MDAPAVYRSRVDEDRPAVPGAVRLTSATESDVPPVAARPPLRWSLGEAIQAALQRNLDVAVARSAVPVAHSAYHVASAHPYNPQFQMQVLPYTRGRSGSGAPVSQQYVVVHTFELAGQPRYRAGAAAARWEQTEHAARQAELAAVAQTERLYFAVLYERSRRDIERALAQLNDELVGVVERRMKAGQATSADVALARLQADSARRRERLRESQYRTALRKLQDYLNLPDRPRLELTDRWLEWEWRDFDTAMREAAGGMPDHGGPSQGSDIDGWTADAVLHWLVMARADVAAARASVAAAQQQLALARAMRTPNLQIGPMWQRDDAATEFWGVQGQFDIPVLNTGAPLVRQRQAELQQQLLIASQTETRAVREIEAARERYGRARRMVARFRPDMGRSMREALRPVTDQFEAGRLTLLDVYSARISYTQARQGFVDLVNEAAQAAADITAATGLPAQSLIRRPVSTSEPYEVID